jgi:hypothetical protein
MTTPATEIDAAAKNLVPALDIFYSLSLVLCQGALFVLWCLADGMGFMFVDSLRRECNLPKDWGTASIRTCLVDAEARYLRDPTSMERRGLVHYAVDLMDSDVWEDNLSGARMLDVFIKQGADVAVRALLLPSRPKVQKLIDMLGWRRNRDLREAAARVVANLAADIHLANFPGAIRCVSSLLSLSAAAGRPITHHGSQEKQRQTTTDGLMLKAVGHLLRWSERTIRELHFRFQHDGSGVDTSAGGHTELILQGLTILERLASDHHNCRDMHMRYAGPPRQDHGATLLRHLAPRPERRHRWCLAPRGQRIIRGGAPAHPGPWVDRRQESAP